MVAGGQGRFDTSFEGSAYSTVSGQNSNNSVRIPNDFLEAVLGDGEWQLRWRTDGRPCRALKARELWEKIGYAAWRCADPGVQFDTTINEWHTCPEDGRINASNPCSAHSGWSRNSFAALVQQPQELPQVGAQAHDLFFHVAALGQQRVEVGAAEDALREVLAPRRRAVEVHEQAHVAGRGEQVRVPVRGEERVAEEARRHRREPLALRRRRRCGGADARLARGRLRARGGRLEDEEEEIADEQPRGAPRLLVADVVAARVPVVEDELDPRDAGHVVHLDRAHPGVAEAGRQRRLDLLEGHAFI